MVTDSMLTFCFETIVKKEEGDVTSIDGLQTCPIDTVTGGVVTNFSALPAPSKNALCHHYFILVNWMREVRQAT